jgi:1-acyl-sn-glycerol-3-phosphate acyltransferase
MSEQRARPSDTLWSVWSWFVFGVCVLVWVPMVAVVYLVTLPFDRTHYWSGYLYRKMPVVHQHLNPLWHFRVTGDLPENPRNPYVVVANHESFVDILLISHLPWEMKWLSKKEMFKIPIAGWLMYLAGDVKLDRGDKDSATKAMDRCQWYLRRKVCVMIFPEGTRQQDGELGRFKDGAFRLAIEAQVPILPLAVAGTKEALRKHDWRFGRADAEVHVMAPVETAGLTLDDLDALRDRVRDLIQAQLVDMREGVAA